MSSFKKEFLDKFLVEFLGNFEGISERFVGKFSEAIAGGTSEEANF